LVELRSSTGFRIGEGWVVEGRLPDPGDPLTGVDIFTGLEPEVRQRVIAAAVPRTYRKGQLLFVEKGRGRVQRRGEPIRDLKEGESDYTAPNVVHWHGAAPDQELVQVNIGFGGETKWFDKVTDEEYNGKRK